MRVLVGTIIAGSAKDYCIDPFERMCAALLPDVDVLAVVDRKGRTSLPELVDPRVGGTMWATRICYWGKHFALRDYALSRGYDALVWQGLDCLYSERWEFDLLLRDAELHPVAGGLVAGRNRADYPVCRRFLTVDEAGWLLLPSVTAENDWTTLQVEVPEITDGPRGVYPVAGYIGSDATIIRADALEAVSMDGYRPWEERADRDEPGALGPDDYWMWSAVARHGIRPVINTRCRPWHVHENLEAVRYRGERCQLADLAW